MKTKIIKGKAMYRLLMLCAARISESGYMAYKAESDKYEILVTIRVKENNK